MTERLDGTILAMFVLEGVDRDNLVNLRDSLRAQGARVQFIGLQRGSVRASDGIEIESVASAAAASVRYYDGLLIPNGERRQPQEPDDEAVALIQTFAEERSPIGAIGNGVGMLVEAGVLSGTRIACDPAIRKDVQLAGPVCVDAPVVSDCAITTGRSDCDLNAFCQAFSQEVESRNRELVDERSAESFPASDAHSGSTAVP